MFKKFLTGRFSPVLLLIILGLSISLLTRTALLLKTGTNFDHSFKNITGAFALGTFFDLAMASYLIVPFVLLIWFTNERIYSNKWKWLVIGSYLIIISILLFTNLVPADFNVDLKKARTVYIVLRFIIFIFLLFKTNAFRKKWRTGVLYVDFFLVIFLLLFNSGKEAFEIVRADMLWPNSRFTNNDIYNIEREIIYPEPEQHHNVVLISVESLSADFMRSLADKKTLPLISTRLQARAFLQPTIVRAVQSYPLPAIIFHCLFSLRVL